MNKQELQKKYQEIVLKTNGGNDDYVVALCQIADVINELDEPKQDNKWQKLKEFLNEDKLFDLFKEEFVYGYKNCLLSIKNKMQELEGEDEEN